MIPVLIYLNPQLLSARDQRKKQVKQGLGAMQICLKRSIQIQGESMKKKTIRKRTGGSTF
jgi:hypothetical protein